MAGIFERLKFGLKKTRTQLSNKFADLFLGKKLISPALFEDLETILLQSDVGIEATQSILEQLTLQVKRQNLSDSEVLFSALKQQLHALLLPCEQAFSLPKDQTSPYVILMVGVNGAGKTTTIGKLAHRFNALGKRVLLAAGDTFRAAAIEQLTEWAERSHVSVISQKTGSDSAAVIFDALQAASARSIDLLLADTAGRLHNKQHLLEELKKINRVLGKIDPKAPHEIWLVLDASSGQNALKQAVEFHAAMNVTGLVITKLDGTAKGGIVFAIAEQLKLPIYFIGVGESIDDLQPFDAKQFVEALLDDQV